MLTKSEFHPLELSHWPRAEIFQYYTQTAPTSYSLTVRLDVTAARRALKQKGFKFFPAYLYLVTRAIGRQQELRLAVQDGKLGYWDTLTPAYPQFHADDQTTSLLWTSYQEIFSDFHAAYLEDTLRYASSHGILSGKGLPPENTYIISCIPWFTFESFSLHNHGIQNYYFPSFEAGAFCEQDGHSLMPLSITVHHAATDGWHIKVFLEALQQDFKNPEHWL